MAISRDKILRTAEKLVQKGKIEQAIREYEKLLRANPNDADTINRVGDLYGRIGRVDDAIALYERIADYFREDGFVAKAIAILKKINRLAPQRMDIYERLADLYLEQGLLVEAKSQFEILAKWYEKEGKLEEAVRVLRRLVDLGPGDYAVRLHLADALMKSGKADEALEEYDMLGRLLLERGKLDEAERLYHHILDLGPSGGGFLEPLAAALLEAGRIGEARKLIERGLELSPDDPALLSLRVDMLLASGDVRGAAEEARALIEAHPDDESVRVLAGRAMAKGGDAARARELLLPAAEAHLRGGRFKQALELFDAILEAAPGDIDVLRKAVQASTMSGDAGRATTMKARLADACLEAGRGAEAYRLFLELSQAEPTNQHFRQMLARLAGEFEGAPTVSGGEEEAGSRGPRESTIVAPEQVPDLPVAAKADGDTRTDIGVAPPPGKAAAGEKFDPEERLAEANVFAKYGLEEKAIRHLEDLLDHFPAMYEARERLAALYLGQNRREDARRVAGPLLEYYRESGNGAKADELSAKLGGGPAAAAGGAAAPEPSGEEEILIIDFEDELAPAAAPEVPAGEAGGSPEEVSFGAVREAGEELEFELDDGEPAAAASAEAEEPPQPVEEPPRPVEEAPRPGQGAHEPASFDPLRELEELEHSLSAPAGGRGASRPAAEVVSFALGGESPEPPAPVELPVEAAPVEELIDVSGAVEGPPLETLEQFDFFVEQQLYEDALRVLSDLEMDYPDDPELARRRRWLKEQGIIVEEPLSAEAEKAEDLFSEEEEYVDLARELEAELAEEDESLVEEATGKGQDEALLEEVFREFQRGVAEQLSEEDSDTHFNLGIAYKEMGLLPEAIGEFEIASKDPAFFLESCSMIGVCYVEQGLFEQAAAWYRKALELEDLPDATRLALTYDLAAALEAAGDDIQALEFYSQVAEQDPSFRDVRERLKGLQRQRNVN